MEVLRNRREDIEKRGGLLPKRLGEHYFGLKEMELAKRQERDITQIFSGFESVSLKEAMKFIPLPNYIGKHLLSGENEGAHAVKRSSIERLESARKWSAKPMQIAVSHLLSTPEEVLSSLIPCFSSYSFFLSTASFPEFPPVHFLLLLPPFSPSNPSKSLLPRVFLSQASFDSSPKGNLGSSERAKRLSEKLGFSDILKHHCRSKDPNLVTFTKDLNRISQRLEERLECLMNSPRPQEKCFSLLGLLVHAHVLLVLHWDHSTKKTFEKAYYEKKTGESHLRFLFDPNSARFF
jgi:hypothetical protein